VNELVDSSGVQYAIIAGLRTETGPERLVIAYPNEKSLRDLLAGSSILAVGEPGGYLLPANAGSKCRLEN
jgi:hypothetical protein